MIHILFAAALISSNPKPDWAAQVIHNLRSTAASCFKIGWVLRDMKDNPNGYIPGAYEKMLRQSHLVCFTKDGE